MPRGAFFKATAALLASAAGGCTVLTNPGTGGNGPEISLGSGDVGLMNYALTLESLEAEFYALALAHPYSGMTAIERQILIDIHNHEKSHVAFFRRTLGQSAIPPLQFDFQRINFSDRSSVLTAARTFEDTGVVAYNGAGHLVQDPKVLIAAGKIVSVEGRHAAAIRDLLEPRTGAFSPAPLDGSHSPAGVLRTVSPYIVNRVDGSQLPKA